MNSHPDEGFTRLALRLHMAWTAAGLSGVQRAVLDVLAMQAWAFGRKGYVVDLTPLQIARRIGKSKRQVNDALRRLDEIGFVRRLDGPARIEVIPEVPAALSAHVDGWYRDIAGGNPPGSERKTVHQGDQWAKNRPPLGGKPPEVGGKPPTGHNVRAREDQIFKNSSSSTPDGNSTRAPIDDDDENNPEAQKQAVAWLADLLPWLAREIGRALKRRPEPVLDDLKRARASPRQVARACASLLAAMRDQNFRPRGNPTGLLIHAIKHPESYPAVDPAALLEAVEAERRIDEERARLNRERFERAQAERRAQLERDRELLARKREKT